MLKNIKKYALLPAGALLLILGILVFILIRGRTAAEAVSRGSSYTFLDSSGREVEIPTQVDKIIPASYSAQILLYTLCPDKLSAAAQRFESTGKYLDKKYTSLPATGSVYDMEEAGFKKLRSLKADLIVEIGPLLESTRSDMDQIQLKTGIPVIFIGISLNDLPSVYYTLGNIVQEPERAEELGAYIDRVLEQAKINREHIPYYEKAAVYWGQGEDGLETIPNYTAENEILYYLGSENAVQKDPLNKTGLIKMELSELTALRPDALLFSSPGMREAVGSHMDWGQLTAVDTGEVYIIPDDPFPWMGTSAAVNQVIGIQWLGNLLYPDLYAYDLPAETIAFYRLFYGISLTNQQAEALLIH